MLELICLDCRYFESRLIFEAISLLGDWRLAAEQMSGDGFRRDVSSQPPSCGLLSVISTAIDRESAQSRPALALFIARHFSATLTGHATILVLRLRLLEPGEGLREASMRAYSARPQRPHTPQYTPEGTIDAIDSRRLALTRFALHAIGYRRGPCR